MNQYPPPYTPRPKKSKLPWILGGVVAVVFGGVLLVLTLAVAITNSAKPENASAPPATSSPSVSKPATSPVPAAPSTIGPLREFGDGIYKVGVDIEPGSYRTEGGTYCFWQRMKDDSGELSSVIANHIGDGPQRVTVKAGEYFEVNRCKWTKA